MSRKDKVFSVAIKVVFIFAFGAFLAASIHHIATFYANFEPASVDMAGSYALAIALDGTALTLTIGVMFFSKSMPTHAKIIVWFFILALTGYSWTVNFEYAARFQSTTLTSNPTLEWINPILASSFAFLNLAYAVVSEFFNVRVKTVEELQAELNALTERASLENQIEEYRKKNNGPGLIERTKNTAIELRKAAKEVMENQPKNDIPLPANSNETDREKQVIELVQERNTGPIVNSDVIEQEFSTEEQSISEQETQTEIPIVNNQETKKRVTSKQPGNARSRVHKVLKVNPDATPTEIVKKAKVSKGYASRIRSEYMSEQKIAS